MGTTEVGQHDTGKTVANLTDSTSGIRAVLPEALPVGQKPERSIPAAQSPQDLGDPMTIDEVANLLGCSPRTVRQRYLRQGLPSLQACVRGKHVFFREQVIAWIEKRQRQKGGIHR